MGDKKKKLISELRNTRHELLERLMDQKDHPFMNEVIMAELYDIEETIKKIENGGFGTCEISGEFLPEDLLEMVPTLKSMDDCLAIKSFYRKAIYD
ncbi:RNA polymerase-binding transcription factor DksA [Cytobacillus horneckiae]|uniref:Uncharacterized protein n=1 Tax=Cytobacillus horneckiae TaxID=549687 RepID=A0A2N0ZM97_9BACI|nr:hypothetical protein [Cytobacillus horneckiae]MBN6887085.1 hypothetical protein [Cytobacillus horneckiae]MEC1156936.1 hypothetical protein [Cytobacillus horneckiae]MED2940038.1 hypothetical protein [Cytobacillus horneckiae]PKG30629.1 hypothetical protein CWS20_03185 [Cytobacillus horneckiae]